MLFSGSNANDTMRDFQTLFEIAAQRKGGAAALEKLITKPKSKATLEKLGDDRWLAGMARAVYRAGFNWRVVENKWPEIETAFRNFNPLVVSHLSDDDLDELLKDPRVIRNWRKIKAIRINAQFVAELAEEHGSASRYFARYPSENFIGLISDLSKHGSFLGGTTAQYFLREMGKDSFILSRDVITALRREDVFDGTPTSKRSLAAIQEAFNHWVAQGGKSLTRVSRVLAMSVV